jgi:hypothetical protein
VGAGEWLPVGRVYVSLLPLSKGTMRPPSVAALHVRKSLFGMTKILELYEHSSAR